jgi:hypothetical protein
MQTAEGVYLTELIANKKTEVIPTRKTSLLTA